MSFLDISTSLQALYSFYSHLHDRIDVRHHLSVHSSASWLRLYSETTNRVRHKFNGYLQELLKISNILLQNRKMLQP
jgi:hypothetical protein